MLKEWRNLPEVLRKRPFLIENISIKNNLLKPSAQKLLIVSDYATRQLPHLISLLEKDDCQQRFSLEDYQHQFNQLMDVTLPVYMKRIRQLRHQHLLRLMIREYASLASIKETMQDWSDFADVAILETIKYIDKQLKLIHGQPRDNLDNLVVLYTIAMGKLGGQELNFSSDIDLIFAFGKEGFTDGLKKISNQEYFTKLTQQFISILQTLTADGFVFRVDLRLRPNGESGPLVTSLASMETYYQEQGRDWERYAMVKARAIANDSADTVWFEKLIIPFVYRRYVDYSVIESLRGMKGMIEREVQLHPMLDDIKRGRGGIREIEFTIQCFQLIRGGRSPEIRKQNAVTALHALQAMGWLQHTKVLEKAYLFLRSLENALQMQNDQQIHRLPNEEIKQHQIIIVLGFENWQFFLKKLHQFQNIIGMAFHRVLGKPVLPQDETRLLNNQLLSLWQGHIETTMAINLLKSLGFSSADRCYQMIYDFRHSTKCRRLSQAARLRLDHFMVVLFKALKEVKTTDVALLQILNLLGNILTRSAYISLLTENAFILNELLYLFNESSFISHLVVKHPFLLEVFITQHQRWYPPTRIKIKKLLQDKLKHITEEEEYNDCLRQFKLIAWLQAARAELKHQCNAVDAGKFLADVAEVIIAEVFSNACTVLGSRQKELSVIKNYFTIIAYGKLGSREMNYDSDVDLVFLHNVPPSQEHLVIRLTQKMLNILTIRTQSGILYAVDTRLRPSGASGLLVSHFDTYTHYQLEEAWTWEHQALIRARIICGAKLAITQFNQLKLKVLEKSRDKNQLKLDVSEMRQKINKHATKEYRPGITGLLDLEFLLQYLILAYPDEYYVQHTQTLDQINFLMKRKIVSNEQSKFLEKAYCYYHQQLHDYVLNEMAQSKDPYQKKLLDLKKMLF